MCVRVHTSNKTRTLNARVYSQSIKGEAYWQNHDWHRAETKTRAPLADKSGAEWAQSAGALK